MNSTLDTLQSSQASVIENPKSDYIKALEAINALVPQQKQENLKILGDLRNSGLDTQLIVKFFKETKDQPSAIRQTASQIYIDLLTQYLNYPKMSFSFKSGIFNSGAREGNEKQSYDISSDQDSLDKAKDYNEQAVIGGQSDVAGNFIIVDVNYYDDNSQKNEHLVFDQDGNNVANYD